MDVNPDYATDKLETCVQDVREFMQQHSELPEPCHVICKTIENLRQQPLDKVLTSTITEQIYILLGKHMVLERPFKLTINDLNELQFLVKFLSLMMKCCRKEVMNCLLYVWWEDGLGYCCHALEIAGEQMKLSLSGGGVLEQEGRYYAWAEIAYKLLTCLVLFNRLPHIYYIDEAQFLSILTSLSSLSHQRQQTEDKCEDLCHSMSEPHLCAQKCLSGSVLYYLNRIAATNFQEFSSGDRVIDMFADDLIFHMDCSSYYHIRQSLMCVLRLVRNTPTLTHLVQVILEHPGHVMHKLKDLISLDPYHCKSGSGGQKMEVFDDIFLISLQLLDLLLPYTPHQAGDILAHHKTQVLCNIVRVREAGTSQTPRCYFRGCIPINILDILKKWECMAVPDSVGSQQ